MKSISNVDKDTYYLTEAENYINQPGNTYLRAQEIAYNIGIHPSDFNSIFRRAKGMTPKKYLDERLKCQVIQLLITNNMMGYELSDRLGFSSEKSFYRWAKRVFGIPFKSLADKYRN